jgi:hypothetical protein
MQSPQRFGCVSHQPNAACKVDTGELLCQALQDFAHIGSRRELIVEILRWQQSWMLAAGVGGARLGSRLRVISYRSGLWQWRSRRATVIRLFGHPLPPSWRIADLCLGGTNRAYGRGWTRSLQDPPLGARAAVVT